MSMSTTTTTTSGIHIRILCDSRGHYRAHLLQCEWWSWSTSCKSPCCRASSSCFYWWWMNSCSCRASVELWRVQHTCVTLFCTSSTPTAFRRGLTSSAAVRMISVGKEHT